MEVSEPSLSEIAKVPAGLTSAAAQVVGRFSLPPGLPDAMKRGGAEGKSRESSASNNGPSPGNCAPRPSQC